MSTPNNSDNIHSVEEEIKPIIQEPFNLSVEPILVKQPGQAATNPSTRPAKITFQDYWANANVFGDIVLPAARLLTIYLFPQILVWFAIQNMVLCFLTLGVIYAAQFSVYCYYDGHTYGSFAALKCIMLIFIGLTSVIWNSLIPQFGFRPTILPIVCFGLVVFFDSSNRLLLYIRARNLAKTIKKLNKKSE